jgi:hypothetical protein
VSHLLAAKWSTHSSSEKKHSCAGKIFNGPGGGITYQGHYVIDDVVWSEVIGLFVHAVLKGHERSIEVDARDARQPGVSGQSLPRTATRTSSMLSTSDRW